MKNCRTKREEEEKVGKKETIFYLPHEKGAHIENDRARERAAKKFLPNTV